MSLTEPIEEQILTACVARLAKIQTYIEPWYVPAFVARTYRPLDAVNEFPGYLVLRAPEESSTTALTLDMPGSTTLASMGMEVLAYGQGTDSEPADRVLIRLLAQAEQVLCLPNLLGDGSDRQVDVQNTRRVLDQELEIGAPWRSLMSHLYRVQYVHTRGDP